MGEGIGETFGAQTFIYEEWYSSLPAGLLALPQGDFPVPILSTQVVHRYPSADSLSRYDCFMVAKALFLLCVCM